MPIQYKKSSDQTNVTGSGQLVTVLYNTQIRDLDGEYDASTGTFTQLNGGLNPVSQFRSITASVILTGLTLTLASGALSLLHTDIDTSAQTRYYLDAIPSLLAQPLGGSALSGVVTLWLKPGDTIKVQVQVNGLAQVVDIVANDGSILSIGRLN